jgi:hypothetical protein
MKGIIIVIILSVLNYVCFADDIKRPTPPTEPVKPVVPGAAENSHNSIFSSLPSLPVVPNRNNQNNEPARAIDRYALNISEAFPNGDTQRNVANTINDAHYTLYSNGNIAVKLKFENNLEYSYHLRNPRSKMETSPGIFRQTYDITIQVDKDFLLEQYVGELYSNEEGITSLSIFGNNKIIVLLNFIKRQGAPGLDM